MKIQIASDLHLEMIQDVHHGYRVIEPVPDADVLVLAGDIGASETALLAFEDWPVPVVYVTGNHEFYRQDYAQTRKMLENFGALLPLIGKRFHYLENSDVVIAGVRFLGATLWTDYALYGDVATGMRVAGNSISDHHAITFDGHPFTPADALVLHQASRTWLKERLAEPFAGKTVVVTHHCPSRYSVHARYGSNPLNAAFASDLADLMEDDKAAMWIHGHTHSSFDYSLRGTRVVCNPAGYARNVHVSDPAKIVFENEDFDRSLMVEV